MEQLVSRREFLKSAAVAGAAVQTLGVLGAGPVPGGGTVKVGLIGCGGRGKGALQNCRDAAEHLGLTLKTVAVADAFQDRAVSTGKANGVPPERWFWGYHGYKRVLETEADLVILATPPNFRPLQFEAAVNAGKHVFMEKPVAVDPPGARRIMAAGEAAAEKGLGVVAGTQRRHQAAYLRNHYAVSHGAIGRIVGGTVMWCGQRLWYKSRLPGESDADYMVRNWVSFTEMSGDHIVEQHVHNIDIANWFIGSPPVQAIGFGGRARRRTGNQFDFFSVDFDYGDGCHIHSMSRQIDGCYTRVSEFFVGTEGQTWGNGKLTSTNGRAIDIPEFKEQGGPYVQEHIDLLASIVRGQPVNEAKHVAEATLTAIMGRISAYTGQLVRWTDLTENEKSAFYNLTLKPAAEDFERDRVTAPADDDIPVPGKD